MTPRAPYTTRPRRPNRRFRRLLPAVLAAGTVATGLPALHAPAAGAHAPKRAHVRPPGPTKAVVVRTETARSSGSQETGAV